LLVVKVQSTMVAFQENNQNSMSWTNRALIKHLVNSIHTCM